MKSNLRSLAHLEEQLGEERFQVLISPYNTGEVMDFCDRLIAAKPGAEIFRSLLAACRQDLIGPDFTEVNYPLEPTALDEADWEVVEHHFEETVMGEQAFAELEKLVSYRLCGPRRAMEFIAAHPLIQLDHPLIITARWQSPGGSWCAPVADRHDDKRVLDLNGLGYDFSPYYGWLVLRKRVA